MRKPFCCAWALILWASISAGAQTLPSSPIVLGEGRVTFGGDVAWSFAPDDIGVFNYSDYQHSTLRMLRLALTASVRAGEHVSLMADIRSENGARPEPYGLYLRI